MERTTYGHCSWDWWSLGGRNRPVKEDGAGIDASNAQAAMKTRKPDGSLMSYFGAKSPGKYSP
jgi:hypothetical protein